MSSINDKFAELFEKNKIVHEGAQEKFKYIGYPESERIINCPVEDNFIEKEIWKNKGSVLIEIKKNKKFTDNMKSEDIELYNKKVKDVEVNYTLHEYMILKKIIKKI